MITKNYSFSEIKSILENKQVSTDLLASTVYVPMVINGEESIIKCLIIDINHDDTTNTIDLRCMTCPKSSHPLVFDETCNVYAASYIRKYLNVEFYEQFPDEVQNMMKIMSVSSNGTTLLDKVKLLSLTELGLDDYNCYICEEEGTQYPITNYMLKNNKGHYVTHITRSCDKSIDRNIWYLNKNGSIFSTLFDFATNVAPVIRLGL